MNTGKLLTLTLSVMCCGVSAGVTAEQPMVEELPTASCCDPIVVFRKVYVNETLPELGSRIYDKVDYEIKLRELTRDIRIAEAELAIQRDRSLVYERDFSRTTALYLTRQEARLDVVKTEEKLKVLRQQKLLALRYRNEQVRYRELLLEDGAARIFMDDK
ncbi:MAG TPA: hypothetical protein P5307_11240 [Pirellulaceae bacterium]|nr:hypothetical protein [Planctomycetales bacterium]MCB9937951.1 hypothetical protein [Planctomycetaceae bacterium]HRX79628.1 hypothetical protein [Pirellulaceae bacterium]